MKDVCGNCGHGKMEHPTPDTCGAEECSCGEYYELVEIERMMFSTVEERNAWINSHYPKRELTVTPGVYRLTAFRYMQVSHLDVVVYREEVAG